MFVLAEFMPKARAAMELYARMLADSAEDRHDALST